MASGGGGGGGKSLIDIKFSNDKDFFDWLNTRLGEGMRSRSCLKKTNPMFYIREVGLFSFKIELSDAELKMCNEFSIDGVFDFLRELVFKERRGFYSFVNYKTRTVTWTTEPNLSLSDAKLLIQKLEDVISAIKEEEKAEQAAKVAANLKKHAEQESKKAAKAAADAAEKEGRVMKRGEEFAASEVGKSLAAESAYRDARAKSRERAKAHAAALAEAIEPCVKSNAAHFKRVIQRRAARAQLVAETEPPHPPANRRRPRDDNDDAGAQGGGGKRAR